MRRWQSVGAIVVAGVAVIVATSITDLFLEENAGSGESGAFAEGLGQECAADQLAGRRLDDGRH